MHYVIVASTHSERRSQSHSVGNITVYIFNPTLYTDVIAIHWFQIYNCRQFRYSKISTDANNITIIRVLSTFRTYTSIVWVQLLGSGSANKKLIRRWDSERELSLRRHCTRTKNTIHSCKNSGTDRFLQRKFAKFSEITQCNGHYAVQGHSRSPMLVPIVSSYTTSY